MRKTRTKKSRSMPSAMPTVGIDLGEETSHATIFANEKMDTFEFAMSPEGYSALRAKIPLDARIVFESSGTAYPFYRRLREFGFADITVAHPTQLAWIVKSKKKNDKVDSQKLAKLHSVGIIPEAHLLDRTDQIFRDLLVQRVKLGAEIARLKCSVIGYLKREGLFEDLPEAADNFSDGRRRAMKALSFGDERDLVLGTMLARLDTAEQLTLPLERTIKARAKESEDVKLLMSIPGVNFYLGSLICSYVGDVRRFPDADHLASFFGVVPAERNSSSIRRVGRMSKNGPANARMALAIMVDTVTKHEGRMREYYAKARNRTGRGKLAHVVTMRKLVRMIFAMLTRRENWRWEESELTRRKLKALSAG
jgi:transposase